MFPLQNSVWIQKVHNEMFKRNPQDILFCETESKHFQNKIQEKMAQAFFCKKKKKFKIPK